MKKRIFAYCVATVSPGATPPTVQCFMSAFTVPFGALLMKHTVFQTMLQAQRLMILLVETTIGKVINVESVLMAMDLHCFLMALPALIVPSTSISGY